MATATKTLRRSTFRESYLALPTKPRIDTANGIIFDVKICGKTSKNKREYTDEALDGAVELYEGAKGYIDHKWPGRGLAATASRSVRDWAGVFKNCRRAEDGIRGDFHTLQKSQAGLMVMEAAEKFPGKFGLSQHATVEGYVRDDGVTVIERIVEIKSVDVVDSPATTSSLFEDCQMDETTPAVATVAPALNIEDAWVALQNAYMASDDHEDPEKLAILKDIMKLKAKALGTADDTETEDDTVEESVQTPVIPAPAAAVPKKNKLRRELRENKIRLMVLTEGVKVTDTVIESMIDMSDAAVKDLLAQLKTGSRKPYGSAVPRVGGRKEVTEAVNGDKPKVEIPTERAALLAWLQG